MGFGRRQIGLALCSFAVFLVSKGTRAQGAGNPPSDPAASVGQHERMPMNMPHEQRMAVHAGRHRLRCQRFERGAFTGAQQAKPGQIELAAGGVLFLDEVTEMTPAGQAKFLRVLQEREFWRLGGRQAIRANVRVIAATNRDLHQAVAQSQFRLDLYYRLNVFDIRIPPFRERREDIVILAESFLQERARSTGLARVELTAAATDTLIRHEWLGNVRELHNALERATIVCEDGLIRAQDLSLAAPIVPDTVDSTDLNVVERQTIERAMRDVNGNISRAARQLGISRTQLYSRLRKHGLGRARTWTLGAPPARRVRMVK
jgi:transcriptional regulator with PAS, ATPase and Fis domain